jgi:hypothetical protein
MGREMHVGWWRQTPWDGWMDVFVLQGEFVERLFRGGSDLVVMAAIQF